MIDRIRIGLGPRLIVAMLIGLWSAAASAQPTSQPSQDAQTNFAQGRPGPAFILERFQHAVAKLDLTDDQKAKVKSIFDQATKKAADLSRQMETQSRGQRLQALVDLTHDLSQQLSGVLTDQQMNDLRQNLGPIASGRIGGPGSGGPAMQNLQQAISSLNLPDDQRQQVDAAIHAAQEKIRNLREQAQSGADVQAPMQQIRQDLRETLQSILTPDQWQALIQSMAASRRDRGDDAEQPRTSQPQTPPPPASDQSSTAKPAALEVGSPVPKVRILELNGRWFMPANYKGHVLVLEFGSMSCPVFRNHVKAMEQLRSAEGPRAFFLVVYTREAFPEGGDEVQRNKEENVSVPQATTLDQRQQQAQQTQESLGITMPMGVDSMDNAVSNAFGTFPNGAVVIGKDGKIAAIEHWCNPDSLRRQIDQAADASD